MDKKKHYYNKNRPLIFKHVFFSRTQVTMQEDGGNLELTRTLVILLIKVERHGNALNEVHYKIKNQPAVVVYLPWEIHITAKQRLQA